MAKLTIYLPDDLEKRLARVRGGLNVSEICQDAIDRAVRAEEQANAGDRRARVLERLRSGRSTVDRVRQSGAAEGRRWAEEDASYDQIVHAANWVDTPMTIKLDHASGDWDVYLGRDRLERPVGVRAPRVGDGTSDRREALLLEVEYWKGFVLGVREVLALVAADMDTP